MSQSYGRDAKNAINNIFRAFIEEIVLSGLNTLNDLNPDKLTPDSEPITYGIYAVDTITKSRIFQL